MITLVSLARALGGKVRGDKVVAPGPGHSKDDTSLTVWLDRNNPDDFMVHSHAGDDPIVCKDYVREKLGLPAFEAKRSAAADKVDMGSLRAAVKKRQAAPAAGLRHVADYDYRDANGELLYQVRRFEPKTFRYRRPDGNGGWIDSLGEATRVPYRLQDLLAYPDASVFLCEGEKDADNVAAHGYCATTAASYTWTPDCLQYLAGRDVFVMEDNDDAGRAKAAKAAQALHGIAKSTRVVRLSGLPEAGDVTDWLDADQDNAAKLADVCIAAPLWTIADAPPETRPLIKSSRDFVASLARPDYVVVGVLQRRFCYSLTGQTGSGKTCVTLLLAASVALGKPFAGKLTKKCRVLYAAAENPDDVKMRWVAMAPHVGFDPTEIDVYFTDRPFKLSESGVRLRAEAEAIGGEFGLVIVDTGPAFFEGDDENSRSQMGAHARLMRSLIGIIPGGPTVIVNCHPVKNATADNLLPAGGGTFLNEVDGNLTCAKNDSLTELHWQGKFRGVEFSAMHFLIKTVTHPDLKDGDDRLMPTVICEPIGEQAQEEIEARAHKDNDDVLRLIADDAKISLNDIARKMGWTLFNGEPAKAKAQRHVERLEKTKLIETEGRQRTLTKKGKRILESDDE